MKKILLVIPCYNEQQRLNQRIFLEFAQEHDFFDFLFVNDGSTDGTDIVLQSMAEKCGRIRHLSLGQNSGKAEAVRTGFLRALEGKYEYIGYWDADLSTPLSAALSFLKEFDTNKDIDLVIGSRVKLLGRNIERNIVRHYVGRVFATIASLTLRLPVYDTQCGAKLFRYSPVLKNCFAAKFLSRWIFDVELLARFLEVSPNAKHRIVEYPLASWQDEGGSKVKLKDFFIAIFEMYQINKKYSASLKHQSCLKK